MAAKIGGSGGDKHTIEQTADINITPFIDILLVLMIIFMVAAPMATVSIKLDLPPAQPPRPEDKQKEPVYITIQENGQLFISDKQTRSIVEYDDETKFERYVAGRGIRGGRLGKRAIFP